jgi:hypothetical protein
MKLYENSKSTVKFPTAEEVRKMLVTMKNRKAPNELSLMTEHLKNGGPIVCYILEKLFNKIYEEGHIPDVFKCGIIAPVYKKHGKLIDDPNSYRRITVCSVIGKIFEKLVQAKIIDKLDSKHCKLQRGFTKGVPPTNADILLTEAIAEALDDNFPLYFVFIDTSKVFDGVWHASLQRRIHEASIQGQDWKIIDEWYKDLTSRVKWDGNFSRIFNEEQGDCQGGILSPLLYKVFINPLIKTLEDEHIGMRIGSVHIGSAACADDILLISKIILNYSLCY